MLKKLLFALLMAAILLLPALTACTSTTPATEPALSTTAPATMEAEPTEKTEMEQLLADSLLALKDVKSYKARLDMDMLTEVTGGDATFKADINMTADAAFDMAANQLHMTTNIAVKPEGGEDMQAQNVSMDMYMLDSWLYMKMDIPMLGEQWMKVAYNEDMAEAYNLNMIDEQLKLLGSPEGVELTGMETVDGVQCYALKVTPDMRQVLKWAQQQGAGGEDISPEEIETIADTFKELTFMVWITEDGKLLRKLDMDMVMEIAAADLTEDAGFDKMVTTANMVMTMYDYNEPVSIVLPAEAQNAQEMNP